MTCGSDSCGTWLFVQGTHEVALLDSTPVHNAYLIRTESTHHHPLLSLNRYARSADDVWGDAKPTLQETRVHAKCLRSLPLVRDYFRNYRAKKRVRGRTQHL